MMGLGLPEMLFIFGAALLLFGPRKLPEIGRTLGKGMAEFRKASAELRRTLDTEAIEEEVRETRRAVEASDPRRYLREAADLDLNKRRVARGAAITPTSDADDAGSTDVDGNDVDLDASGAASLAADNEDAAEEVASPIADPFDAPAPDSSDAPTSNSPAPADRTGQ